MSRPDMPQGTEREGGRGKGEGPQPLPTRVARVLRRIIGAPDYEAYVEHCRRAGRPPLSEREYLADCFERKGQVARCC